MDRSHHLLIGWRISRHSEEPGVDYRFLRLWGRGSSAKVPAIAIDEEPRMKTPLLLLSTFLGVVLTVHLAMNGMVGAALNNARVGNAIFWCIGAVTAVIIGVTGWETGVLRGLTNITPPRRGGG